MVHIFDIDIAIKYGEKQAIMLNNLAFWQKKNQESNKNFYDGCYWTYNSVKAFQGLFPYWTVKQIRTILDKLEEFKIIKSGNYNTDKRNRTKWYTIIDPDILQKNFLQLPKKPNKVANLGKSSITDNKHTDNKLEHCNKDFFVKCQTEEADIKSKTALQDNQNNKDLHNQIRDYFVNKNQSGYKDFKKQGAAINSIIKRAKLYYPEFSERDTLRTIVLSFYDLVKSGSDFWRHQPFLPSTLNSQRIWDMIINHIKKPEQDKAEISDMVDVVLKKRYLENGF